MFGTLLPLVALTTVALPIRVDGEGYLRLVEDGRAVFAREATLVVDRGEVRDAAGRSFLPRLRTSGTTAVLEVDLEGHVFEGQGAGRRLIGRLVLAGYPETAPRTRRNDVYVFEDRPALGNPGEGLFGVIRSGHGPAVPIVSPTTAPPPPPASTAPATGGPLIVTCRDESEITGETYRLGDIARIQGPAEAVARLEAIELGSAPPFRTRATVTRFQLTERIRRAGFDPKDVRLDMNPSVYVRRATQTVTRDQLVAAATEALERRGLPTIGYRIEGTLTELEAPVGDLAFESSVSENGLVRTVNLSVVHGSSRIGTRSLRFLPDESAIGVRRGEPVRLFVRSGGASVEVSGTAQSDAMVGGEVVVRLDGNRTQRGIVLSRGIVEVRV